MRGSNDSDADIKNKPGKTKGKAAGSNVTDKEGKAAFGKSLAAMGRISARRG